MYKFLFQFICLFGIVSACFGQTIFEKSVKLDSHHRHLRILGREAIGPLTLTVKAEGPTTQTATNNPKPILTLSLLFG